MSATVRLPGLLSSVLPLLGAPHLSSDFSNTEACQPHVPPPPEPSRRLTLAQAAALLPGPVSVPEELLRLILYGDIKGVTDIWVVKVSNRENLEGAQRSTVQHDEKRKSND